MRILLFLMVLVLFLSAGCSGSQGEEQARFTTTIGKPENGPAVRRISILYHTCCHRPIDILQNLKMTSTLG